MSRIRYDRPRLVYIDNLRRELSKATSGNLSKPQLPEVISAAPKRVSRISKHIAEIEMLGEQQQLALSKLIESYALYVDAFSYEIAHLALKNSKKLANNNQFFSDQVERINSDLKDRVRPKKKSADFYSDLVKDGVELLRQSIFDNLAKRTSSADWLMKFFKLMPKADREAWRLLDECLVEECVPLVEDMLERQGLIGVLSAKQ